MNESLNYNVEIANKKSTTKSNTSNFEVFENDADCFEEFESEKPNLQIRFEHFKESFKKKLLINMLYLKSKFQISETILNEFLKFNKENFNLFFDFL